MQINREFFFLNIFNFRFYVIILDTSIVSVQALNPLDSAVFPSTTLGDEQLVVMHCFRSSGRPLDILWFMI